jgi:hypothetical protein
MFITSNSKFLAGAGASSLVGELAKKVGQKAWLDIKDVELGKF